MNEPVPIPACVPPDVVLTAIGDVHGRLDLLEPILRRVEARAAAQPGWRHIVICLGDLIDRGPDSAGVVERLLSGVAGAQLVTLMGNHEEVFLRFFDRDPAGVDWLDFGGIETLRSYGVAVGPGARSHAAALQSALAERIPPAHVEFFRRLRMNFTVGDYFFVHAGVRPGRRLDAQTQQDMLWIRSEFLDSDYMFEKKIVHGHTPRPLPEFRRNRINLDTGAFASNQLTAAVFIQDTVTIL